MLVSILVPIYKVEEYISRCLDSIFDQTYSDLEYIFVDDKSPDRSLLVLEKYINDNNLDKSRITILSHSINKGIAITRNDCLAHAKGEYVLFVDSDDWIESNMIEELVKGTHNNNVDIVGCHYIKEYVNGNHTYHRENYASTCIENLILSINYDIATTLWKVLIRKKLFNNVIFHPNIEIGEDYIASIKLYYYGSSFFCVGQYLYHYVQSNTNRYSNQISKSIDDHINAVVEVEKFLRSVNLYNDEIDKKIKMRKFGIKSYFLSKPLLNYKRWKEVFPESNRSWRFINYTKKEKIKFWLAEKHLFILLLLL